MGPVLCRVLFAIGIPLAVFAILGSLMMNLTGRDQFSQTADPASTPLNFRISGYDKAGVRSYWTWLGSDGRIAERRFLLVDLAFPVAYGAGLLAGLFLAWAGAGRPFGMGWLVAPVVITVLADWTENLVHLAQLSRFVAGNPLQAAWIKVASVATSTKMLFFIVATVLILVLCGLIMRRG